MCFKPVQTTSELPDLASNDIVRLSFVKLNTDLIKKASGALAAFFFDFMGFSKGLIRDIICLIKVDSTCLVRKIRHLLLADVVVLILCILLILFAMGAFDGVYGAVSFE